jgi:prepilin-type N-terminal cleavage/methylation domain-containing protein
MTHFKKNNSGFTIIEVMMALMIMGLVFGSVYVSQGSAIAAIKTFALRLQRILAAKEFLIEMTTGQEEGKQVTQQEKQLMKEGPATRLLFTQEAAKGDTLKNFNDMVVEKVRAEWQEGRNKRIEEIVTLSFKPKKEKKQ